MHHHFRSAKLRGFSGPAPMLDTKDIERQRLSADGNDPVFADDAILIATGNDFSGKQKHRLLAAIDEDKLVHRCSRVVAG
jgi:hypothetical protein